MAGLARVLERQELRVEAGQLPHPRTLWVTGRLGLGRSGKVRGVSPSAGTRPDAAMLVDLDELHAAYRREPAGPRRVRDLGSPWHLPQGHVHRSPRPGHQRGDRAPPKSRGDNRAAVRRARHARAVRAGLPHRGLGLLRPRDRRPRRRRRRLHADAGAQPRDPHPPRQRRDRAHAEPQPARGRRLQVQPAERWAGGHGHHQAHRGRGQPDHGRPRRDRRRTHHPTRLRGCLRQGSSRT